MFTEKVIKYSEALGAMKKEMTDTNGTNDQLEQLAQVIALVFRTPKDQVISDYLSYVLKVQ